MAEKLICRTCLEKQDRNFCKNITPESENEFTSNILEMLSFCVPEINIHLLTNPVICGTCISLLETSYKFKDQCVKSEEKILQYSQEVNSSVDLNSVVKLSENEKPTVNNNKETVNVIENVETTKNTSSTARATQPKNESIEIGLNCKDCLGCKHKYKDPAYHKKVYISPFICYNCDKTANDIQSFRRHINNHRRQKRCKVCQKDFRDLHNLLTHFKTHTKTKTFNLNNVKLSENKKPTVNNKKETVKVIETVECTNTSTKTSETKPNEKSTKSDLSCQDCSGCKYKYKDPIYHTKVLISPFICYNCDKRVNDVQSFRSHINSHRRRRKCKVCQKDFRDLHNLTTHLRMHTRAKTFTCKICSKSFKQEYNLKEHMRQHVGHNDVKCNSCNKVFSTKYNLKIHVKNAHSKKLKCELCGKKFSTKADFIKHLADDEPCFKEVKSEPNDAEEVVKTEPELMYPNELTNQCKEENVIVKDEKPSFADVKTMN